MPNRATAIPSVTQRADNLVGGVSSRFALLGLKAKVEGMVLRGGIEPTTSPLPRECSTTELPQRGASAMREPAREEIGAREAPRVRPRRGAPARHAVVTPASVSRAART